MPWIPPKKSVETFEKFDLPNGESVMISLWPITMITARSIDCNGVVGEEISYYFHRAPGGQFLCLTPDQANAFSRKLVAHLPPVDQDPEFCPKH